MLKKYTYIFFLVFAYAILLGHNFSPHHHYDTNKLTEHSHHHAHDDHHHHNENDSEEEDDDFGNLFSNLIHGDGEVIFLRNHSFNNIVTPQVFNAFYLLKESISFEIFQIFPKENSPPGSPDCYNSPYFLSSGLRAPPFFIV